MPDRIIHYPLADPQRAVGSLALERAVRVMISELEELSAQIPLGEVVQLEEQAGLVQQHAGSGVQHGLPTELGTDPAEERMPQQPVLGTLDAVVRALPAGTGQRPREPVSVTVIPLSGLPAPSLPHALAHENCDGSLPEWVV